MMKKFYMTASICAGALILPACAMTKSAVDLNSPVSVTRSFKDVTAARAIKARMLRVEGFDMNDISVDVINGVVLLAGAAPRDVDKVEAERIAWSAPGVTQVGNEIYIGDSKGFGSKTKDELITTAVRARMAGSNNVRNLDYTVETRNGVVYLMGVARNQSELKEAARLASITRGVTEVVSYVTLAGDMPNGYNAPYQGAVIAQNETPYGAPSAPSPNLNTPDDLSYWGEPIADTAPPSGAGSMATPIDPNAPLPYSPGATELDPDALNSGEPIYRDPYTGEVIELPPGTKVIPYQPSTPGGLGAGGRPPPGLAALDIQGNIVAVATEFRPVNAPQTRTITILPAPQNQQLITPAPVTQIAPYAPEPAMPAPAKPTPVIWDGNKWVRE